MLLHFLNDAFIIFYGGSKKKKLLDVYPPERAGFFVMNEFCVLRYDEKPSLPMPDQIIYAGQSPRRKSFFNFHFPNIPILQVPAGEEPDIPDVIAVAHGKIDNVLAQLNGQIAYGGRTNVMAADTRTSVAILSEVGCLQFANKGKPKTVVELENTFTGLAKVAEIGVNPQYVVESGAVSYFSGYSEHSVNEKRNEVKEECIVDLNPDWVEYLSTDEGLRHYLSAFYNFYSNKAYTSNSNRVIGPRDLSGGLSLPVLVKLGAVDSVAGISRDSAFFQEVLKYEIFIVAIGVSPELIESFNPKIRSNIAQWPWLNEVAHLALEK